eukprot:Clim_evm18s142 gene=Clim_evmTU18s142
MSKFVRGVKAKGGSPVQRAVRGLTSNDDNNLAFSRQDLRTVHEASHSLAKMRELQDTLSRRLNDSSSWRHCLKALLLIEFLVRNGGEAYVQRYIMSDMGRIVGLECYISSQTVAGQRVEVAIQGKARDLVNTLNSGAHLMKVRLEASTTGIDTEIARWRNELTPFVANPMVFDGTGDDANHGTRSSGDSLSSSGGYSSTKAATATSAYGYGIANPGKNRHRGLQEPPTVAPRRRSVDSAEHEHSPRKTTGGSTDRNKSGKTGPPPPRPPKSSEVTEKAAAYQRSLSNTSLEKSLPPRPAKDPYVLPPKPTATYKPPPRSVAGPESTNASEGVQGGGYKSSTVAYKSYKPPDGYKPPGQPNQNESSQQQASMDAGTLPDKPRGSRILVKKMPDQRARMSQRGAVLQELMARTQKEAPAAVSPRTSQLNPVRSTAEESVRRNQQAVFDELLRTAPPLEPVREPELPPKSEAEQKIEPERDVWAEPDPTLLAAGHTVPLDTKDTLQEEINKLSAHLNQLEAERRKTSELMLPERPSSSTSAPEVTVVSPEVPVPERDYSEDPFKMLWPTKKDTGPKTLQEMQRAKEQERAHNKNQSSAVPPPRNSTSNLHYQNQHQKQQMHHAQRNLEQLTGRAPSPQPYAQQTQQTQYRNGAQGHTVVQQRQQHLQQAQRAMPAMDFGVMPNGGPSPLAPEKISPPPRSKSDDRLNSPGRDLYQFDPYREDEQQKKINQQQQQQQQRQQQQQQQHQLQHQLQHQHQHQHQPQQHPQRQQQQQQQYRQQPSLATSPQQHGQYMGQQRMMQPQQGPQQLPLQPVRVEQHHAIPRPKTARQWQQPPSLVQQQQQVPAASSYTPTVEHNAGLGFDEVDRMRLVPEKQIGSGHFGSVHMGKMMMSAGEAYNGGYDRMNHHSPFHHAQEPPTSNGIVSIRVAIKVLRSQGWDPEFHKSFMEESAAMRNLSGEFVVNLIGVNVKQQPYLMVMEFMDKGSLEGVLRSKQGEHLSLCQRLWFSWRIAECMHFLETQSYVHRDLAARNILLADGGRIVKLGDFGLARSVYQSQVYSMSAPKDMPVQWMAEESLARAIFTTKSDVWSYGMTLFEIFSNAELPWPGVMNHQVLGLIRTGARPVKPESCPLNIYNSILIACWNKDPNQRPSFRQLADQTQTLYLKHGGATLGFQAIE